MTNPPKDTPSEQLREQPVTSTYSVTIDYLRMAVEKVLYKRVTSFRAVNYEELTDDLMSLIEQRDATIEREARIDELKEVIAEWWHPRFCKKSGAQFKDCPACYAERRLAQLKKEQP